MRGGVAASLSHHVDLITKTVNEFVLRVVEKCGCEKCAIIIATIYLV